MPRRVALTAHTTVGPWIRCPCWTVQMQVSPSSKIYLASTEERDRDAGKQSTTTHCQSTAQINVIQNTKSKQEDSNSSAATTTRHNPPPACAHTAPACGSLLRFEPHSLTEVPQPRQSFILPSPNFTSLASTTLTHFSLDIVILL